MIVALAFPTLCGFIIASFILKRDARSTLLERVVLGFALGLGLLAFSTFYMGILRIPFTFASLFIVQVVYTLPVLAALIFLKGEAPRTASVKQTTRKQTNGVPI